MHKVKRWFLVTMAILLCSSMGYGQAFAADTEFAKNRLAELYEEMEESDLESLRVSRDRINEIIQSIEEDPTVLSEYEFIIDGIWKKISAQNVNEEYSGLTKKAILRIGMDLASTTYDPQQNTIGRIQVDPELRPAMEAILEIAGVEGDLSSLSLADISYFMENLESRLDIQLDSGRNLSDALFRLASSFAKYDALLNELKDENVTAKILHKFNISLTDIVTVVLNVASAKTPSGDQVDEGYKSLQILAAALIGFKDEDSKGGGKRPGGPIYLPVDPILTPDSSVKPLPLPDNFEDEFREQLSKLQRKIQQAIEENNGQVRELKNLVSTIEKTLREATTTKTEADPEIIGGKAVLELDAEALIESLDANAELRETLLAEVAGILDSDLSIELEWVIQVTHEGADQNEVKVPYEAIAHAKELGITRLTVQVGGALVSVPLTQVEDDILFIVEHTEVASDTSLPGDVRGAREIRAEDGDGNVLEDLGGAYFKVGVPVDGRNPSNPYLTMFRIGEDGENMNVGGQYNHETGLFEAYRNSFSTYVVIENRVQFDDIEPVRSWAYQAIHELAAIGIVSGRGDGEFDPLAPLTRAEFATMLVNLLNVYDDQASESFTDVADGSWYQPFIASAVQAGLVHGRSDDTFAPQDQVTRAEMAVMAARALKQQLSLPGEVDIEAQFSNFNDTEGIYEGMQEDLALAIREGIIGGVAEGKLQPLGDSNRAQAAVIIYRLHQLLQ